MKAATFWTVIATGCVILINLPPSPAADWPQWRGVNRDAKVTGFKAPSAWPKELTKKWKVTVGNGVATPALVGDKMYVYSRVGGDEVLRCIDANTGKDIWQEKDAQNFQGRNDGGFPGPRCSPVVADGKVVVIGVNGNISCHDAASGKQLWRKDDLKGSYPMFHTSSSPLVVDGLCIVQLGGDSNGALIAYDLAGGAEKWRWKGETPAYASPIVADVGGTKVIVAVTRKSLIAVNVADGKEAMHIGHSQGRYNASSPVFSEGTLYAGANRGAKALQLARKDSGINEKELWSNPDNSVAFNSFVLKDGLLFGLSDKDGLFCIDAKTGKTAWSQSTGTATPPPGGGGGGGMRGGGRTGYGSVVDAGPVLFALTPKADLVVFEPTGKEFKQLAKYKVAEGDTYAYPIVSDNRIYIKDRDGITLWSID